MRLSRLTTLLVSFCIGSAASVHDGPCNKPDSITTVTASGDSNYEFGFNVGRATALQIAARMATSQFQTISAFAQTPPGAQVVDILSANVNFTFPQFIEEAQGLADGAGVTLFDILVFNMYDELETVMPGASSGTDAAGNDGVSTSGGAGINSRDSQCSDILLGPPASSGSSALGSRPINGKTPENAASVNAPRWIAHNEDARTLNFGLMYLLDGQVPLTTSASSSASARSSKQALADDASFASAPSAAAGTLSFTAYMYAGVLPTGALAYVRSSSTSYATQSSDAAIQPPSVPADAGNPGAGLYFTLNGIFPLAINTTAPSIPRAFLHRYVLESSGLDDAIDRLSNTQVACGFSINIGQVNDPQGRLYNVETNAIGQASAQLVSSGQHYYHANMYRRVTSPQLQDASSIARLARMDQLPTPMSGNDSNATEGQLFQILGDTFNATYPIYRPGIAPDCCATMTTVTFQVVQAASYRAQDAMHHAEAAATASMRSAAALANGQSTSAAAAEAEVGVFTLFPNNPKFCNDPLLVRTFP